MTLLETIRALAYSWNSNERVTASLSADQIQELERQSGNNVWPGRTVFYGAVYILGYGPEPLDAEIDAALEVLS